MSEKKVVRNDVRGARGSQHGENKGNFEDLMLLWVSSETLEAFEKRSGMT